MDGNGRWAKQRGLPRVAGHRAGAEAVRRALQAAADNGVEVLTIYAFSSENWRRSAEEISDLTALMRFYLERELKTLEKERRAAQAYRRLLSLRGGARGETREARSNGLPATRG